MKRQQPPWQHTAPNAGLTNYLDVVVAQVTALDARLAEVEVQFANLEGAVGLVRALGGGWDNTELPAQDSLMPMKATQYKDLDKPTPVSTSSK